MNYQIRNSDRNGLRIKTKIIIGAAIVLLLINLFAPRTNSGFFSAIFSPLWRLEDSILSAQIFTSHVALVAQNATLEQELESLDAASSSIALLEQENGELKTMLGRPPAKNTILAVVLKKPPFLNYDSLVIDIGSDNNITNGDLVYAISPTPIPVPEIIPISTSTAPTSIATSNSLLRQSNATSSMVSVPIGSISQINTNTSDVTLFSSAGQKYNVEIGPKHIAAVAVGRGGGTFEITLPRESNIQAGDVVILPNIDPLVFATVSTIVSNPALPYATILFQSEVNPFELHWVMVAKTTASTSEKSATK